MERTPPAIFKTACVFVCVAHSATMLIQTVEAYRHGAPRDYKDVILFGMVGIVVLLMVPSKEEAAAIA
jgi:hypothetical protein